MMKHMSRLRNERPAAQYSSLAWHDSKTLEGVRFAIRKVSLAQRLELTHRVRELTLRYEFLRAGDAAEQLEATLSDLLVRKLYLEWGLAAIEGLCIDGQSATIASTVESGPESLADEIVAAIRAESGLSDEERKNS
jgi:hypothetical protein